MYLIGGSGVGRLGGGQKARCAKVAAYVAATPLQVKLGTYLYVLYVPYHVPTYLLAPAPAPAPGYLSEYVCM